MNESQKYGIIAGVGTVAYMLLFYLIDRPLILDWKVYWSSFLIYFFCMYKVCLNIRSGNEMEVLTLAEGLRAAFVTFLIANAIFYVFYFILFNFVDPGLIDLQEELAKEMYLEIMPKDKAQEMIKAMEQQGFEMNISTVLLEYAKGAIVGFGFSLFIAAITRQE